MRFIKFITAAVAILIAATACACIKTEEDAFVEPPEEEYEVLPEEEPVPPPEVEERVERAKYIRVVADGVNVRQAPSLSGTVVASAQRDTLYACYGKTDNFIHTAYNGKDAYICADYCTEVQMDKCINAQIERVIEEGCRLLGTKYVYGAVRYHDGNGVPNKNFEEDKFDCSSLMQYIFKRGAGINLQVTTRTQIMQGMAVDYEDLARGDLMFFTNSSRKDKSGIERVGHVALYFGEGYILHTSSDFAKIEKLSTARMNYFIQANRIL